MPSLPACLLRARPTGSPGARGLLAGQAERAGACGEAEGGPTAPAPGCRLRLLIRAFAPHVCLRSGLTFPPLPGSEGNPAPAEQSPAVAPREDTAPAACPGHPPRAEVPGPPAAGASGPDPAASGGRSHLGWRLRRGQERLIPWLLCGNVQDPYKDTHDPGWKRALEGHRWRADGAATCSGAKQI